MSKEEIDKQADELINYFVDELSLSNYSNKQSIKCAIIAQQRVVDEIYSVLPNCGDSLVADRYNLNKAILESLKARL